MLVVLHPDDPRPIYRQIVDQVKEQIMTGLLNPGDELPSVRELAGALGINMHTVHRAYQALKDQDIIHMRLGQKVHIARVSRREADRERAGKILGEEMRRLLVDGYHLGFSRDELLALFQEQLRAGKPVGKEED